MTPNGYYDAKIVMDVAAGVLLGGGVVLLVYFCFMGRSRSPPRRTSLGGLVLHWASSRLFSRLPS